MAVMQPASSASATTAAGTASGVRPAPGGPASSSRLNIQGQCGIRRLRSRLAATPGDQTRQPFQRAQVVQVDAGDVDAQAEALLDLHQQLHELEGIQDALLQQVGGRFRYRYMEVLGEQRAELFNQL